MKYWAMVDDDETCYVLVDGCGLVHGYVLQLEPELWRWRTAEGEGTERVRDDAMDAAEDSLEDGGEEVICESGQSPYLSEGFGIGRVMFVPDCDGSPEDRAVAVTVIWNEDADEEEVDQRLETWAGLPCLSWFRFHLADVEEHDVPGGNDIAGPGFHILEGYTDAETALELKANSTVYLAAYGDRTPHDG